MTLIELLMVMALLGLLLGAGVGMLSSLDLGHRASVGLVQNVIRSARNSAVARGAPARVRLDPSGTITAEAMEVVGTWHFEGDLVGAFGFRGVNSGGVYVDDGWIGRALSFAGQGGSYAEFPVGAAASWDFSEGFAIECAVRLEQPGAGHLLDLGGAIGLDVTENLAPRAWLRPFVTDTTGTERAGGKFAVEGPAGALVGSDWHRVRFEYDRRTARLLVDNVEVAREELELPVWSLEGPLVLADSQRGFPGSIDNLIVSAVAASESVELPEGTAFSADAPALVRFDAGGHLDREVHSEPVEFHLEFDDGDRIRLRIGMYGTVEG
jgi:prepilin-type N-terminal cleavage/methylation domain-containing protein